MASAAAALAAAFLAGLLPGLTGNDPRSASATSDPVIVAAGDIACDPSDSNFAAGAGSPDGCHEKATARLAEDQHPTAVLTLGDDQYEDGELSKFERSYGPSWGQLKSITHPAIGNHEYNDPAGGASGYFHYFGSEAGSPSKGYYSYDLGTWHLIALNSECRYVGGCQFGSPQEEWLRRDLASHSNACTLAYWHEPRWSSGQHGSNPAYGAFWTDLYRAGADLVLVGHDHDYERFAPQDPNGKYDPTRGVREFVVGTGGKNHYVVGAPIANSQVRNDNTFGVLRLTLHPTSYDWRFLPEPGGSFTDSGSSPCVGSTGATAGPARIERPPLFQDSFESGQLSRWSTVQGLRAERSQAHGGSWGAIASSGRGGSAYVLEKLRSPQQALAYRVWFKVLHQGPNVVDLLKLRTGSGAALVSVFVTQSGVLGYQNNVTTHSTSSSMPVTHGVWHSLELRVRLGRAGDRVKTWLDGSPVPELTQAQTLGTAPIGSIQLGENVPGRSYAVAFDDVVASPWGR